MERSRHLAFCLLLPPLLAGACWSEFPEQTFCGNELIEQGETCDGSELGLETCRSIGHRGGTLGCNADCTHDLQGCELWYPGWEYRRLITVEHTGDTIDSTDVLIMVDTQELIGDGHLQLGCADLRFVELDDVTGLLYFVEAGCNEQDSQIWVQVPDIPDGGRTFWMYYGNPVASLDATWNQRFIAIHSTGCPEGWDPVPELNDNRFIRGDSEYGHSGGAESHNHPDVTGPTCGREADRAVDASGNSDFIENHYHEFTLELTDATALPPYLDVTYCGSRDLRFTDGLAALFDTEAPSGWYSFMESGEFPRGTTSPGGSGGNAHHIHSYPDTTTTGPVNGTVSDGNPVGGVPAATPNHNHPIQHGDTQEANNIPPYRDMVFARASTISYALPGLIVIADALPPLGWHRFEALDGWFPRGSLVPGATGGEDSHAHAVFEENKSTKSPGNSVDIGPGTDAYAVEGSHQHYLAYPDCLTFTDPVQHLPRSLTVIFAQRQASLSTLVGDEEVR